MAVHVETRDPSGLLAAFKAAVNAGRIRTWAYDSDGDFTHSAEQWNRRAWLRPHVGSGVLTFTILGPQGQAVSREIYGIYHGRFIETLLIHFDQQFGGARATALAAAGDVVAA
jgi:hypothetical protein